MNHTERSYNYSTNWTSGIPQHDQAVEATARVSTGHQNGIDGVVETYFTLQSGIMYLLVGNDIIWASVHCTEGCQTHLKI